MHFEPATSLTEKIADHLGTQIIAGHLTPGSRIQELKVAAELGVSRGSVREALLILERRHLVQILPRRGAVVSGLDSEELNNCSELVTELQTSFYSKLAGRRQSIDLGDFEESIQRMTGAVHASDLDGMLEARKAFTVAGFHQLNNYYLVSVLKGLIPAGLRLTHLAAAHPDYDLRDSLRYHQALLKSIGDGDPGQIGQLVHAFNGRERRLALNCLEQSLAQLG